MSKQAESPFEFIDVQWMSVFTGNVQSAFRGIEKRATDLGWHLSVTALDDDGQPVTADRWPDEPAGRCRYVVESGEPRTLFWNAVANDELTTVAGGLYLSEYAGAGEDLRQVCDRVANELFTLTATEENLCTVIASEDDDVSLAPVVAGTYRKSLWEQARREFNDRSLSLSEHDGWIRIHPVNPSELSISIESMPEDTRRTLLALQDGFEAALSELRHRSSGSTG